MEKSNKINIIIILSCFIITIGGCIFLIVNHDEKKISDAVKFKNEYEQYNESVNENNQKIPSVNIAEENPIVYKPGKEILDVLENETAIIYFGFATCPWCRNIIEPLLSAAKEQNVGKIYYVDIKDMRDEYKYNGNNTIAKNKDGTKAYYEILNFFGDKLDPYILKDDEGNDHYTGVTRLYAPTVIAIKDKEIKNMHVSTLKEQKDPYTPLNDEEKEKLKNTFVELIQSVYKSDTCDVNSAC